MQSVSVEANKMRKTTKKKMFLICAFVIVKIMLAMILSQNSNAYKIKYVLVWSFSKKIPFSVMLRDKSLFFKKKCPFQNCYVTKDRSLLNNVSTFDAILFHGPGIIAEKPQDYLPKERSANQIYIFTSIESSHNYRAPDTRHHDIFNFTWTYKLNSDISLKYMVIRDHEGNIIGPNADIDWIKIKDMSPIKDSVKTKLANKNLAATWIVSNCKTLSKREKLASRIARELIKYNMTLDIYGACGSQYFSKKHMKMCLQILQRDYFFYFAFENSFSVDYVTEKLLHALQNYAVPIVYGTADYKR